MTILLVLIVAGLLFVAAAAGLLLVRALLWLVLLPFRVAFAILLLPLRIVSWPARRLVAGRA
jgi:hypothetical protein